MSALQKRIQDLAFAALDKIGELAKSPKADDARFALSAIERIVTAVRDALAKKITPSELAEKIRRESAAISDQVASNKKTVADEAAKKFGPKT